MNDVIQAVNDLITAGASDSIRTYIKQHFPNAEEVFPASGAVVALDQRDGIYAYTSDDLDSIEGTPAEFSIIGRGLIAIVLASPKKGSIHKNANKYTRMVSSTFKSGFLYLNEDFPTNVVIAL